MKYWIVAIILSIAADASAEEYAAQIVLNQQGAKAAAAKDYKTAIAKFSASLEAGPLNVTYLNLGRAFQKRGDCVAAYRAFKQVETAPSVAQPPPEKVNAATQKFVEELTRSCPAKITLRCSETAQVTGLSVSPDTCNVPIEVAAGTYSIHVTDGPVNEKLTITVTPGEEITQTVATQMAPEKDAVVVVDERKEMEIKRSVPPVEKIDEDNTTLKIILFTSAGVALVGGVFLDGLIVDLPYAENGKLEAVDFVPVGLYLFSAGLFTAGFVF